MVGTGNKLYINTFALGLVELHVVLMGPLPRPVQVPLDSIPSLKPIHAQLSLLSPANLLRGHSMPQAGALRTILNSVFPSTE